MAGPSFSILIVLILISLAILGVAGLALLIVGLRGRRVSDHPHCRKCKFDLHGVYEEGTGRGEKCPECGTDLCDPRAVRAGMRKKRPVMLAIGAFLFLLPITAVVASGVIAARRTDLNPYKPTWMLTWEANHRDPGGVTGQIKELNARWLSGNLTAETRKDLVRRALAVQADPKATWRIEWGELVEAGRATGLVTDEEWGQFGRNAVTYSAAARPRVSASTAWTIEFGMSSARGGSGGSLYLTPRLLGLTIDGVSQLLPDSGSSSLGVGGGGRASSSSTLKVQAEPGEHEVVTHWLIGVKEGFDSPPLIEWEEQLGVGKVTVLKPGESPVELVNDPELRGAVERAIPKKNVKLTAQTALSPGSASKNARYVSLVVNCDGAPMQLAFEVVLRRTAESAATNGEKEWRVATLTFSAGQTMSTSTGGDVLDFDESVVDVVLRRSVKAAEATVGISKIWDGEIVIEGVEVKAPGAR